MVDLSTYVRVGRYDLPEPTRTTAPADSVLAQEVSAVTYNKDTDTLFVVGDGGTSIVQVSKTGALIDSMTLATGSSPQGTEFYDTEGLTYIGGGKFVMVEERDRTAVLFTYEAGGTLTRAETETVHLGTNVGNVGFEGLSYDPLTGGFIFAKEKDPESVFQTTIDFAHGTASNGSATTVNSVDLFDPANLHVADIADVFALSNLASHSGDADEDHLLILSQESAKVLEVDRSGNVLSTLTIVSDPGNPLDVVAQQHEGITMDDDGFIYVVSENGGGDFDHPQLWVYAPSTEANQAPTAIDLVDPVASIEENTSTTQHVKIASIAITDDGIGNNALSLSGPDAGYFEVDSTGVYLKAGTVVDYEAKSSYSFTVNVDDPNVGTGTPDAHKDFTLAVTDVANETTLPRVYVSEVAPWSSGNSPVGADWFEITNGGATTLDLTGWKFDDSSASFASAVALSGVTSLAPGQSAIFLETATPAGTITAFVNTWFGGTAPAGVQIGSYTGGGVGLSTGGDAVNIYDSSGALQANVTFGGAPTGPTFATFNNAAGVSNGAIATLSVVGENGAIAAINDANEIGSPGSVGRLAITEVAPWSSGTSVGADWFEVTNNTAQAIDVSGWKMDDSSGSPAAAVALNGITSIAAGESVIFLESADQNAVTAFVNTWFGGHAPDGLQIGTYSGGGVGLSASSDAVNLYDGSGTLQASVSFGASPTSPLASFDNTASLNGVAISTLSSVGTNGAFAAVGDANEIGSPGDVAPVVATDPSFTSPLTFDAAENQLAAAMLAATDPQSDAISFSIVGGADQALFGVNATTGAISFLAAPDFEAPADANHDNAYVIDVRATDSGSHATTQTITVHVTDVVETPPTLIISEVAPWSSGSTVGADWFEVTNKGTSAIDLTGWKVDDSSASFASAVALHGVTSIAAGESVIFLESADQSAVAAFIDTWFGGTAPAGLQIGTYSGSGIGLSSSGDAVNLYNSSGVLQAGVSFGASPSGATLQSFDNAAGATGTIATLSAVSTHGGFVAANDGGEIGSPGTTGKLFISEIAPNSSSSTVGSDWFELTNGTSSAIDINGWKFDDSSASPGSATALQGIISIAAGESVIFIESPTVEATQATIAKFVDTWFGGTAPVGLHIGTYTGSGVGLSAGGDAVNIYDSSNALVASLSYSAVGNEWTVDNSAGRNGVTVSGANGLSTVGTNGAFVAAADPAQIGTPGTAATTNDAPVATGDAAAANEDATVTGNLLANDSDPQPADVMTLRTVEGQAVGDATVIHGAYGTLTVDTIGHYSYVADADVVDALATGEQRTDSFDYAISDGHGGAATATLSVVVTAIDDSVSTTLTTGQTSFDGGVTDDHVDGNGSGNSIRAGAGADVVDGGAGADSLSGGAGDDSLIGGLGEDYLFGGSMGGSDSEGGSDTLMGGDGADHIWGNSLGGAGNPGDGADVIDAGDGVDYVNGNGGNDTISGGDGRDRLFGGRGDDSISGDAGQDEIDGNLGNDILSGGADNDVLHGGDGNDRLSGDGGNDQLFGDAGADTLTAGAGVDILTGGTGADVYDFSGAGAGNLDLAGFYTSIADFEQGVDHVRLGFSVGAGDVLQTGSFGSISGARSSAQTLLTDHAGTHDVAAATVGTTTYLFYNAAGSGDQITAVIALNGTAATAIDQTDFVI